MYLSIHIFDMFAVKTSTTNKKQEALAHSPDLNKAFAISLYQYKKLQQMSLIRRRYLN